METKNIPGMDTKSNIHIYHTKKLFFVLFFLLSFTFSNAQSFSNLGFEYWQGNKFPLFWQHPGITVSSDSVVKLTGQYALKAVRQRAEVEAINIPYGLLFQNVKNAFDYTVIQNQKLEVSARIKSTFSDTSAHVCVFVQIADPQNPANSNIVMGNNVANQDWGTSSASITIGKTTPDCLVLMGVIMTGKGEMWIDDYQVKCNQQFPPETYPRTADLTEKEKKELGSNIIPIINETLSHKKQFAKKISNARLVGIGDNVHGSASVIQLKNIISKNLIGEEDFTLLAIEDSPGTGEALNQYVLGLTDTEEKNKNMMYASPDFKNFLSWLREYNKSAAQKIRIFGVDINPKYEDQIEYINQVTSNKYAAQLDSIYTILDMGIKNFNPRSNNKISFTQEQKQYYKINLEHIKQAGKSMNIDNTQKILLDYYANNLLHYLTVDKQEREKQMAENINWLLSRHPNEKMIYLAHNGHVGNKPQKTGAWLKEWLGDKYYIIGSCYFDGTDSHKKAALGHPLPVINESVKGSYEYLFNQIKNDCFYLDLSKLTENQSNKWLFQPMLMREYGVEPFNYYHEFSLTDLTRMYDGIVFIKRSIPL